MHPPSPATPNWAENTILTECTKESGHLQSTVCTRTLSSVVTSKHFLTKNIIILINADFIYIIPIQGDSHWKMIGLLFTFCAAASLASGFPTGETHDSLTRARDGKG